MIKLMIMGDLHYPGQLVHTDERMNKARDAYFEQYLRWFLAFEADYYLSVGDLTHAGTPSEFRFILGEVSRALPDGKFLYVLGNHDTECCAKSELAVLTGQPRYMAIESEDAALILLDTARESRDDWSGTVDAEQLDWLREQVSKYGTKPLFVFAHHPISGTTARSEEPMMSLDPKIDLMSVLKLHRGPGFYFNGHNHVQSIVRHGSWHFIQASAVPDLPAALVVDLHGERFVLETIYFEPEAGEQSKLFVAGMYDYDPRPDAAGDGKIGGLSLLLPDLTGEAMNS
ncbi:metallophosphoesterase family protein [Paenibacillus chitinolyticus]